MISKCTCYGIAPFAACHNCKAGSFLFGAVIPIGIHRSLPKMIVMFGKGMSLARFSNCNGCARRRQYSSQARAIASVGANGPSKLVDKRCALHGLRVAWAWRSLPGSAGGSKCQTLVGNSAN